jgi:hypothetical protein
LTPRNASLPPKAIKGLGGDPSYDLPWPSMRAIYLPLTYPQGRCAQYGANNGIGSVLRCFRTSPKWMLDAGGWHIGGWRSQLSGAARSQSTVAGSASSAFSARQAGAGVGAERTCKGYDLVVRCLDSALETCLLVCATCIPTLHLHSAITWVVQVASSEPNQQTWEHENNSTAAIRRNPTAGHCRFRRHPFA